MTNQYEIPATGPMHPDDIFTYQHRASRAEIARYYDGGMVDDPSVMPDYEFREPVSVPDDAAAAKSARRIGHRAIFRSF